MQCSSTHMYLIPHKNGIFVNYGYLDIVALFGGSLQNKRGILGYRIVLSTSDKDYLLGNSHLYSIATGTWYNARVSKSPCEYRNRAVTFYFVELERARDQKELPHCER